MKKSILRSVTTIVLLLILTTSIYTHAVSVSYVLGVSSRTQSQRNWCWAASGSSKLSYQTSYIGEYSFAVATIGAPPANIPISFNVLKSGLTTCGLSTTNTGNLFFSSVKSKIYSGKPIIAGILWSAGGGHMVEIYGYNETYDDIYVMDPGNGSKVIVDHALFTSNTTYTWHESNY